MRVRDERPEVKLMNYLISLARRLDEENSESRAVLAELRRGDEPLRIARHVEPHLNDRLGQEEQMLLYRLATLFAWHRRHQPKVSLGAAFRTLQAKQRQDGGEPEETSEEKKRLTPAERRFLELLTTPRDRLMSPLHHAVRLLESKEIGFDWHQLTYDLLHWEDEGHLRQHALARDFYRRSDTREDSFLSASDETFEQDAEGDDEE